MTDSRISGAEEPSATSVRLATVSFHTMTRLRLLPPLPSLTLTSFSWRSDTMERADPQTGRPSEARGPHRGPDPLQLAC